MKCDSSLTLTLKPSASFSPWTMPTFFVTPPVKVTSGSMPTRRISPSDRDTIDRWTPSRMSSTFFPRPSHEITSDSANTVHVVLILTGRSDRQVRAIADAVEQVLVECGEQPIGSEGQEEGRWVLLDFSDLIVHVFQREVREDYALERLWADAAVIALAGGRAPAKNVVR